MATPFLYAALGETIAQTSGVVNLGVDGIMLLSAFAAFYVALTTGSLWLGLLAAALVGLVLGLLMSFVSVTLKAEQGVSGIGLYMFGLGMSSLLFKVLIGTVKTVRVSRRSPFPLLADIPVLGPMLFQQQHARLWGVPAGPPGLVVAGKDDPRLEDQVRGPEPGGRGFPGHQRGPHPLPQRLPRSRPGGHCRRFALHIAAQPLPGQPDGGAGFHRRGPGVFRRLEPRRRPGRRAAFQRRQLFQLWMQVLGVKIPSSIAVMLPYILTIAALTVTVNRMRQPAALNKPFERGES